MKSFLVACVVSLSVALLGLASCGDSESKASTSGDPRGEDTYSDADSDSDADADGDADTEIEAEATDTESEEDSKIDTDEDVVSMWSCLICDDRYED